MSTSSFRDEEADEIKDSLPAVAKDKLLDVKVHDSDSEEAHQFLLAKLQLSEEDDTAELSHPSVLMFGKTDGNPFLMLQFVDSLREN